MDRLESDPIWHQLSNAIASVRWCPIWAVLPCYWRKVKDMSNIVVILGLDSVSARLRMKESLEVAEAIGGIDLRFVDNGQTLDEISEQCQGAVVILPQGR